MGGFVASEVVEPLAYNLEPFVKGAQAKGVVPEPSQADMRKYRKAVFAVTKEFQGLQDVDGDKLSDAEIEDLQEKSEELEAQMDKLTSELCKGTPSQETLSQLPWRHKIMFSKWLQEQFNPEAWTSATKK